MNSNTITSVLFLAYKAQNLYFEVIFNILTLHYHVQGDLSSLRIVIYTDNEPVFRKYLKSIPLTIEILTKEQVDTAIGSQRYFYRLKPVVFLDCFKKYNSNIFYLDGDTLFLKDPRPLIQKVSKEISIMNADEYDLVDAGDGEERNWLLLRKAIRNNTFNLNGEIIKIPFTTRMWNSGVTGISIHNATLLNQVIDLIDQIYSKGPAFHTEQFALSYVFQNSTKLLTSEDYILHYWKDFGKVKFDYHFQKFFKINTNLSVDLLAKKAFELVQQRDSLEFPKPNITDEAVKRIKMVASVIIRGKA